MTDHDPTPWWLKGIIGCTIAALVAPIFGKTGESIALVLLAPLALFLIIMGVWIGIDRLAAWRKPRD